MLLIIVGKTSSGKDKLLKAITEISDYEPVVSYTTRPIRKGEIDGIDYNFLSETEFKNKIENNEIIEYREYQTIQNGKDTTWYYGTGRKAIDTNKNQVAIIDVKGLKYYLENFKDGGIQTAYVMCDFETRRKRSLQRDDNIEEIERRLKADDIAFSDKLLTNICDHIIVSSDETTPLENAKILLSKISRNKKGA